MHQQSEIFDFPGTGSALTTDIWLTRDNDKSVLKGEIPAILSAKP